MACNNFYVGRAKSRSRRVFFFFNSVFVFQEKRERSRVRRLFMAKFSSRWCSGFSIQFLFAEINGDRPKIGRLMRVGESAPRLVIYQTDADAPNINLTARNS
jgi:hypothetical protein